MTKWKPVGGESGGGGGTFVKWVTEGQELEGLWQGEHEGRFGPVGTLTTTDRGRINFALHTALQDRMKRIKEGAEVKILYLGFRESKAGRKYKDFTVFVTSDDALQEPPSDGDAPF